MAAFQTYNENYGTKIYSYELRYFKFADTIDLLQIHRSNLLTLFELKNENLQNTEKISANGFFSDTGFFTSLMYINRMVWLKNTDPVTL